VCGTISQSTVNKCLEQMNTRHMNVVEETGSERLSTLHILRLNIRRIRVSGKTED
jgi:hypothetical protein